MVISSKPVGEQVKVSKLLNIQIFALKKIQFFFKEILCFTRKREVKNVILSGFKVMVIVMKTDLYGQLEILIDTF